MLRWGLDKESKKLVSINDAEQGKNCNCFCPACETALVAHKGDKTTHHFKHYSTDECIGGVETAIHIKAKEIIASAMCIKLPGLYADVSDFEYQASASISPRLIQLDDEIFLERKEGQIKPDLIVSYKGIRLLVEIAVTHFIDSKKADTIRRQGISCVEIDLSQLHKSEKDITDDELIEHIIYRLDNKKWIYNTKYPQLWKRAFRFIEEKKEEERQKELLAEENLNNRVTELLKKNPKITIDEDNIFMIDGLGAQYTAYSLLVDLYTVWKIPGAATVYTSQEMEKLEVNFEVNVDDNTFFVTGISFEEKFLSNNSLEAFLHRKIRALSYQEGLSSWLRKRAKE